jgi:Trypsin-like peptidase domain
MRHIPFCELFAALCLASTFSCSNAYENDEHIRRGSSAVIGGEASGPEHDAVVYLFVEPEGESTWEECSGTLLSPHVVLTARHCVSAMNLGEFVCDADGELVQGGSGAGMFGAAYPPSSIAVFIGGIPSGEPDARAQTVFATTAPTACRDDFAAVVLDRAIVLDSYPPIAVARKVRVGEAVTVVGYGLGEPSAGPERRERSGIRVVDVGTEWGMGTTPPRSFAISGGTVCFGDSGGPALSTDTGALLGVYSRITGDCFAEGTWNIYMDVGEYASVTQQAFALAGEAPTLEETATPDDRVAGDPSSASGPTVGACNARRANGQGPGARGAALMALLVALGVAARRQDSGTRLRGRSMP